MRDKQTRPVVLVIGATGQTGALIAEEQAPHGDRVRLRLSSRREARVRSWNEEGKEAVLLDLDDPSTFGPALHGVDRVFLLTGYTVDMLVQSKTLVDAAVKAGVSHIVHWGVFAHWDCIEGHFTWHQLVETYIEASGIGWTHLHPNYFMENLINVTPIVDDKFVMFSGDARWGWTALTDAASVAAQVLLEGEQKHGGKNYWLSSESLNGDEAAAVLSEELGRTILCDKRDPAELEELFNSGAADVEITYARNATDIMRQIQDGRMAYMGTVRDDVPYVTGKRSITFRDWIGKNKEALLGQEG